MFSINENPLRTQAWVLSLIKMEQNCILASPGIYRIASTHMQQWSLLSWAAPSEVRFRMGYRSYAKTAESQSYPSAASASGTLSSMLSMFLVGLCRVGNDTGGSLPQDFLPGQVDLIGQLIHDSVTPSTHEPSQAHCLADPGGRWRWPRSLFFPCLVVSGSGLVSLLHSFHSLDSRVVEVREPLYVKCLGSWHLVITCTLWPSSLW